MDARDNEHDLIACYKQTQTSLAVNSSFTRVWKLEWLTLYFLLTFSGGDWTKHSSTSKSECRPQIVCVYTCNLSPATSHRSICQLPLTMPAVRTLELLPSWLYQPCIRNKAIEAFLDRVYVTTPIPFVYSWCMGWRTLIALARTWSVLCNSLLRV